MSRPSQMMAACVVVGLAGGSGCVGPAGGPSSVGAGCDARLWDHVYEPERLENQTDGCVTVTGTVDSVENVTDGDVHFLVRIGSTDKHLLNQANWNETHGDLVTEIICLHPTQKPDAAAKCSGYVNQVRVPRAGDHVRVQGTHVLDESHGWMEIHPVTRLEVL